MNVHWNRDTVFKKYLLEKHTSDFACLDKGLWHKVSLRAIQACPAGAESFAFDRPGLHKDIALPWNFGFYATP